jgi:hypothetical protein
LHSSVDPIVRWALTGGGEISTAPPLMSDPDYSSNVGVGGISSPTNAKGGPAKGVLIFGQDLTQAESRYRAGLGFGAFCPTIAPSPAPTVQSFPYPGINPPGNPPPGCTSGSISCRADYYGAGVICSYTCNSTTDPVPYIFKAC